jgi:DNA-binding CsgD family transcriptional regulator
MPLSISAWVTSRCWTPSCRSRSIRRRASSAAARIRARDAETSARAWAFAIAVAASSVNPASRDSVSEPRELLGDRREHPLRRRPVRYRRGVRSWLQRVAGGGAVIDPALVQELVRTRKDHDPLAMLSAREREVLALMAEGRSNGGIARQIWVAEATVEKHVHSILGKLDLPDSTDDHRRVLAVLAYLSSAGT